ncbi:hypothetical protein D3C71_1553720 [compost metagenome]
MGQSHRAGYAQPSPWLAGHAGHGFIGHLGLQQHRLAMAQVTLAHCGQLELTGGALQQAGSQTLFQFSNAS